VVASPSGRAPNPYVGPRPFAMADRVYGRDRETTEIADLLEAERVLLLHAPSGAGKTSVLQSGVTERLRHDGFLVSGPLRLNLPPPADPAGNRYVRSVAAGLGQPADLTLADALDEVERGAEGREHAVVFDQFEEILTLDQSDHDGREEFFRQLAYALAAPHRYALFAIREDYLGGLDHHLRQSAGIRMRYRLDLLTRQDAAAAISRPAQDHGVYFAADAVDLLIEELSPAGRFIEPFALQVVCRGLWQRVSRAKGADFHIILAADVVKNVDVGRALRQYYADAVREAASDERLIRDWFETELVTPQGLRALTRTRPATDGLLELQDRYLIRSESRGGVIWYELAHDQLIRPILEDNAAWRRKHLSPWQLAAFDWQRHDRDRSYLLTGDGLAAARRSLDAGGPVLQEHERDFLRASEAGATPASRGRVLTFPIVALTLIAVGEGLVIAYLLLR
jgi:hypothetical protein